MKSQTCLALAAALLLSACGGGWLLGDDEVDTSGTAASASAATSTGTVGSTETSAATSVSTGSSASASATAAANLTCNTAGYVAGSVELPSAAQLAAYAGTYEGDEGNYGATIGAAFVKSGSATMVLGVDGALTYKGTGYAVTSACIEKASGTYGKILYVVAGKGHLDISDKVDPSLGSAWGIALSDGKTIFTKGARR
jgi:hypothetical protein